MSGDHFSKGKRNLASDIFWCIPHNSNLIFRNGLCNGRSKTDFKTRLKLESYYSNHMSLKMDIKIFFGTFSAVFGHVGAK